VSSADRELEVASDAAGKRLDLFVGEALGLSRARVKRLFEEGAIRVDGRSAKKGQVVAAGQKVRVTVVEEDKRAVAAELEVPLRVLREDPALLFVDKPAQVPSHPLRPGETGTVANALIARYPECAAASEDDREGGLCHRLDVETSGVLLAARTRPAWEAMRKAFSEQQVDKRYWALVSGPIADSGEVDLPLRHHPRHADRVEPALEGLPGREARSDFTVLGRSGDTSLVEVRIHTGVLHQVRAHLASIGASIVGDSLYGGRALDGLGRFFLHARSLEVTHPESGERIRVQSPLPEDLQQALRAVGISLPE